METQAIQVRIEGKVQGVGYRASTHRKARSLGLKGWVRNLPDGSVEAFVQGPADVVSALLEWFSQGPPGCRVDKVSPTKASFDPAHTSFEVKR